MTSHFFSPRPGHERPVALRGEGVFLYDGDGRRWLDGSSGAMTANLGHGDTAVAGRIREQLGQVTFTYRSQFSNAPLEELSAKIAALAPGDLDRVAFANSGSEAAELALKLAHSYWRAKGRPEKTRILSRWNSYHGSTLGALSMTGHPGRRKEYSSYLQDWPVLELPFCHRCPYEKSHPDCGLFCARQLQKAIDRLGSDTIAAAVFEPVTGASGAGITPPEDYLPLIRDICRENGILLIMDEVITGFGRTGAAFASDLWNVVPDLLIFGKGVTSGFGPLSGVVARQPVYEAFREAGLSFSTGHTFSGNPLSAAAACAVLDEIVDRGLVAAAGEKGALLRSRLARLAARYPFIDDIRGKGLLLGVGFAPPDGSASFPPEERVTDRIVDLCFDNGLVVYPSAGFLDGIRGDSILLSPPLTISNEEIGLLADLLETSLELFSRSAL